MKNDKTDFTQGSIPKKLALFMLPILGSLVLQAAYGAVDLLVVGRFGSTSGLSAVSTGSQVLNLVTFVVTQLAMGVTVLIARYLGEKKHEFISPVIGGAVKQFWTDVCWGEVDYMFVDLPPGTGDVMLTVFQSLPVDGVIVVASPQELVGMIVEKAVKMAEMMKVPVLGLIENMSTYTCPDCGKQHAIFGESHLDSIAAEHHIPVLARLPIQPALASLMDTGTIELFEGDFMQPAADRLCALLPR